MVSANLLQPLIDAEEWLLEGLHQLGLGWGLAIVGLTVLVRLGTLPLTVRQVRAQREFQRHLPELKRLQQRHRKDRDRLRQETLAYYSHHGINPLATVTPILVQIPIFISLYYLMRTDVRSGVFENAGFLFIPSLTEHPHGAVAVALVLAYASSQLASTVIATRTLEPGHRKLALALPLLFAGIAARFPAGLALYWVTSSLWGLGQRLVVWRLAPVTEAPPPETAPVGRSRPRQGAAKKRRRRKRRR